MQKLKRGVLINPIKISPGLGAAYAAQGFRKAIPLFHSAPGCSFLSKVILTQHFMDPVAVSGSDIKETALVFGGTTELESAVKKFLQKNNPEVIFVLSSSVPEIRGEDYSSFLNDIQKENIKVIVVQTPDFDGGFSEGYSNLVYRTIDQLAMGGEKIAAQVNILPAAYMTPGDIDEIKIIIESFHLDPVFIPDISLGADGSKEKFISMSPDGATIRQIESSGRSIATISFGNSMKPSGELLKEKFGVKHIHMDSIYGLTKTDNLVAHLMNISPGTKIAHKLVKERARLKDIMIDTHLLLKSKNAAVALEYDQATAYCHLLNEIGMECGIALSPVIPSQNNSEVIRQGTLYDAELSFASGMAADILICNSHGKELSRKFNIPLIRSGFPVTDIYGYNYKTSVAYKGAIAMISDLANIIKESHDVFHGNSTEENI